MTLVSLNNEIGRPLPGLLLWNLNSVTILGEPYYLLYVPIMVT